MIKKVLNWKIDSLDKREDNVIEALLSHHFDKIAIEYMGYFNSLLNEDLFIYCIKHGNNEFL